LHVTVFDTVVDHLDIVTSTFITDPVTARLIIRLGSNALEDILDIWPCLFVATGHERRAVAGTFLATRDAGSYEANALFLKVSGTTVAVRVVGVSTINDDITLLAERQEFLNEVVNGRTGHDQKHHAARLLEFGDELFDGVSTNDGLACVMSVDLL
jgi:hypothetical protein